MTEDKKTLMQQLNQAIIKGDQNLSIKLAQQLASQGVENEEILSAGIEPAMNSLDNKCTAENFNLLEIMLAGRAVTSVIKTLFKTGEIPEKTKGTIVLATLEGDVHDLGKNIVKMVMTAKGFRVIDCGKNAPLNDVIDKVEQEKAFALGISGLITSIVPLVKKVKEMLDQRGLSHVKVLAGGAALKQATKELLKVDYIGDTAFDGSHYVESMKRA
ncbi:MAG: cobalamin-dependent protein [Desulfobacterales bacterium]|nr:cobalamin-dependent protein [Desulfobacterales bacterium]